MKNPGKVALRAVAEAIANVGVQEQGGNNRGKFIAIYLAAVKLLVGNPWCLAFVVFRLQNAAQDLGLRLPSDMPHTGYTPTFANWAKASKRWTGVAEAKAEPWLIQHGDLVFFYGKVGAIMRICHVGFVTGLLRDKTGRIVGVRTVEGNTGPKGLRDSNKGDGVWEKERHFSELGVKAGFVRLPF